MDLRDTLSAELPPPRDDEPIGLRQDILDELADHLGCAYHRELLRGANPAEARQRVLTRFGDPAAVARRLWLDAMKGKIMAQRILIATCLVVTLASLTLTAVIWRQSVVSQRQSAEAQRRAAEMTAEALRAVTLQNEKSQASQAEMLRQLRALSEASRTPRSPDWNPVKFKLTEDAPDGAPVAGCSITLQPQKTNDPPRYRTSDASGIVDMGILHPGLYTVRFSKSWNDGNLAGEEGLTVEPGSDVNKVVVFPRKSLERVPVRIRCPWPADLEKEGLVLDVPFHIQPIAQSDVTWRIEHRWAPDQTELRGIYPFSSVRAILWGPRQALAELFGPQAGLNFWVARRSLIELRASVLAKDVHVKDEPEPTLMWERGHYDLLSLAVLRPLPSSGDKKGIRHFQALAVFGQQLQTLSYPIRNDPPTEDELKPRPRMAGGGTVYPLSTSPLSVEAWSQLASGFEVRPGRVNEWTISLPDELVQAVRERLKAAKP
jgi:hypothetical protein